MSNHKSTSDINLLEMNASNEYKEVNETPNFKSNI